MVTAQWAGTRTLTNINPIYYRRHWPQILFQHSQASLPGKSEIKPSYASQGIFWRQMPFLSQQSLFLGLGSAHNMLACISWGTAAMSGL